MNSRELPQFSGENPEFWIDAMEEFLCNSPIPYEQYVHFASQHLVGVAQLWFTTNQDKVARDWCAFVYNLIWEFDKTSYIAAENESLEAENESLDLDFTSSDGSLTTNEERGDTNADSKSAETGFNSLDITERSSGDDTFLVHNWNLEDVYCEVGEYLPNKEENEDIDEAESMELVESFSTDLDVPINPCQLLCEKLSISPHPRAILSTQDQWMSEGININPSAASITLFVDNECRNVTAMTNCPLSKMWFIFGLVIDPWVGSITKKMRCFDPGITYNNVRCVVQAQAFFVGINRDSLASSLHGFAKLILGVLHKGLPAVGVYGQSDNKLLKYSDYVQYEWSVGLDTSSGRSQASETWNVTHIMEYLKVVWSRVVYKNKLQEREVFDTFISHYDLLTPWYTMGFEPDIPLFQFTHSGTSIMVAYKRNQVFIHIRWDIHMNLHQQFRQLEAFKGGTCSTLSGIGSRCSVVTFFPDYIHFHHDSSVSSVRRGTREERHFISSTVGAHAIIHMSSNKTRIQKYGSILFDAMLTNVCGKSWPAYQMVVCGFNMVIMCLQAVLEQMKYIKMKTRRAIHVVDIAQSASNAHTGKVVGLDHLRNTKLLQFIQNLISWRRQPQWVLCLQVNILQLGTEGVSFLPHQSLGNIAFAINFKDGAYQVVDIAQNTAICPSGCVRITISFQQGSRISATFRISKFGGPILWHLTHPMLSCLPANNWCSHGHVIHLQYPYLISGEHGYHYARRAQKILTVIVQLLWPYLQHAFKKILVRYCLTILAISLVHSIYLYSQLILQLRFSQECKREPMNGNSVMFASSRNQNCSLRIQGGLSLPNLVPQYYYSSWIVPSLDRQSLMSLYFPIGLSYIISTRNDVRPATRMGSKRLLFFRDHILQESLWAAGYVDVGGSNIWVAITGLHNKHSCHSALESLQPNCAAGFIIFSSKILWVLDSKMQFFLQFVLGLCQFGYLLGLDNTRNRVAFLWVIAWVIEGKYRTRRHITSSHKYFLGAPLFFERGTCNWITVLHPSAEIFHPAFQHHSFVHAPLYAIQQVYSGKSLILLPLYLAFGGNTGRLIVGNLYEDFAGNVELVYTVADWFIWYSFLHFLLEWLCKFYTQRLGQHGRCYRGHAPGAELKFCLARDKHTGLRVDRLTGLRIDRLLIELHSGLSRDICRILHCWPALHEEHTRPFSSHIQLLDGVQYWIDYDYNKFMEILISKSPHLVNRHVVGMYFMRALCSTALPRVHTSILRTRMCTLLSSWQKMKTTLSIHACSWAVCYALHCGWCEGPGIVLSYSFQSQIQAHP